MISGLNLDSAAAALRIVLPGLPAPRPRASGYRDRIETPAKAAGHTVEPVAATFAAVAAGRHGFPAILVLKTGDCLVAEQAVASRGTVALMLTDPFAAEAPPVEVDELRLLGGWDGAVLRVRPVGETPHRSGRSDVAAALASPLGRSVAAAGAARALIVLAGAGAVGWMVDSAVHGFETVPLALAGAALTAAAVGAVLAHVADRAVLGEAALLADNARSTLLDTALDAPDQARDMARKLRDLDETFETNARSVASTTAEAAASPIVIGAVGVIHPAAAIALTVGAGLGAWTGWRAIRAAEALRRHGDRRRRTVEDMLSALPTQASWVPSARNTGPARRLWQVAGPAARPDAPAGVPSAGLALLAPLTAVGAVALIGTADNILPLSAAGFAAALCLLAAATALPFGRVAGSAAAFADLLAIVRSGAAANTALAAAGRRSMHRPTVDRGLVLRAVRTGWDGPEDVVLDGLVAEFPAGTMTGVLGAPGAGKSTIARILGRRIRDYGGRIEVDGVDLRAVDPEHWAATLAIVSAEADGLPGALAAGGALPEADEAALREALKALGVGRLANRLPLGPDGLQADLEPALSRGERVLVTLAGALASDARLILIDGALDGLDAGSRDLVFAALAARARQRTVLLLSVDPDVVDRCDRRMRLEGGRLVEPVVAAPPHRLRQGARS
ncbi:ATP-binding cassette domain-containing protein [Chthonobacter rhizosphaerae]|uniref:ATP-binding cassette domain-containing protein n=1 Tax=Chthonobacter rhizosphaerae TaxID=2735553 RepID=UPI0015EF7F35